MPSPSPTPPDLYAVVAAVRYLQGRNRWHMYYSWRVTFRARLGGRRPTRPYRPRRLPHCYPTPSSPWTSPAAPSGPRRRHPTPRIAPNAHPTHPTPTQRHPTPPNAHPTHPTPLLHHPTPVRRHPTPKIFLPLRGEEEREGGEGEGEGEGKGRGREGGGEGKLGPPGAPRGLYRPNAHPTPNPPNARIT